MMDDPFEMVFTGVSKPRERAIEQPTWRVDGYILREGVVRDVRKQAGDLLKKMRESKNAEHTAAIVIVVLMKDAPEQDNRFGHGIVQSVQIPVVARTVAVETCSIWESDTTFKTCEMVWEYAMGKLTASLLKPRVLKHRNKFASLTIVASGCTPRARELIKIMQFLPEALSRLPEQPVLNVFDDTTRMNPFQSKFFYGNSFEAENDLIYEHSSQPGTAVAPHFICYKNSQFYLNMQKSNTTNIMKPVNRWNPIMFIDTLPFDKAIEKHDDAERNPENKIREQPLVFGCVVSANGENSYIIHIAHLVWNHGMQRFMSFVTLGNVSALFQPCPLYEGGRAQRGGTVVSVKVYLCKTAIEYARNFYYLKPATHVRVVDYTRDCAFKLKPRTTLYLTSSSDRIAIQSSTHRLWKNQLATDVKIHDIIARISTKMSQETDRFSLEARAIQDISPEVFRVDISGNISGAGFFELSTPVKGTAPQCFSQPFETECIVGKINADVGLDGRDHQGYTSFVDIHPFLPGLNDGMGCTAPIALGFDAFNDAVESLGFNWSKMWGEQNPFDIMRRSPAETVESYIRPTRNEPFFLTTSIPLHLANRSQCADLFPRALALQAQTKQAPFANIDPGLFETSSCMRSVGQWLYNSFCLSKLEVTSAHLESESTWFALRPGETIDEAVATVLVYGPRPHQAVDEDCGDEATGIVYGQSPENQPLATESSAFGLRAVMRRFKNARRICFRGDPLTERALPAPSIPGGTSELAQHNLDSTLALPGIYELIARYVMEEGGVGPQEPAWVCFKRFGLKHGRCSCCKTGLVAHVSFT